MADRVLVMNDKGVWATDCTAPRTEAQERAKFLMGRVPAVKVEDPQGRQVRLEGA